MQKFRQIADEVSVLVSQFKGSLAGEHGVGIARTEFLKAQIGDELYRLMKEIKHSFDPNNVFNPGKIISDGHYKIDRHLRWGADYNLKLPFEPQLAFAAKDGSFTGNLEQCNGCGGCLKQTPTMCPTYLATGEEIMSTRGRANAIRTALERRGTGDPLHSTELETALSNCLSCKACTSECPSNVNMALLKAELLHARIRRDGLKLRERMLSSVDLLGRVGCTLPGVSNYFLESRSVRLFFGKLFGFTTERPLPPFAPNVLIIGSPSAPSSARATGGKSFFGTTRLRVITSLRSASPPSPCWKPPGLKSCFRPSANVVATRIQHGQSRRSRAAWPAQSRRAKSRR
ncbi:MAG: FAD-linked oxidase C-terminal domain-containing protein [Limisphaerales bacterium]